MSDHLISELADIIADARTVRRISRNSMPETTLGIRNDRLSAYALAGCELAFSRTVTTLKFAAFRDRDND